MGIAIKAENLSKAYQLGEIGTGTISRDIERWFARVRGKEDPFLKIGEVNDRTVAGGSNVVWSLKDINFEIRQGDAVGIIGRNGAGKSTLLKILSRVTSPTTGIVKARGRIASLLEVGTGFHPELTGRENIYLNGAILGMRKKEIDRKFDEIVDFSGVDKYIDTPVKRYSSGMYVRLAFAVAAHLESEILIVDEVLAVGDAEFQKKCLGKMKDVSVGEGRTVLFVSHNMQAINNLCDVCIVMNQGGILYKGPTKEALNVYAESFTNYNSGGEWRREKRDDSRPVRFMEIKSSLNGDAGKMKIDFLVKLDAGADFKPMFLAIDISTIHTTIMQALPSVTPFITVENVQEPFEVSVDLPPLIPGVYYADFWIGSHNNETADFVEKAIQFEIIESPTSNRTFPHSADHGFVVPESQVNIRRIEKQQPHVIKKDPFDL
jgi:lipopolysaccharide transport system ATP-binding protein